MSAARVLTKSNVSDVLSAALTLSGVRSRSHASASCDSALTCPYARRISWKSWLKALLHVQPAWTGSVVDATCRDRSLFGSTFDVCGSIRCVLGNPL